MNLINEAVSLARMRSEEDTRKSRGPATRPARRVAAEARRQQARELGEAAAE